MVVTYPAKIGHLRYKSEKEVRSEGMPNGMHACQKNNNNNCSKSEIEVDSMLNGMQCKY